MSKKQNHENKLISSMMEHLEIDQPDPGFTKGVMDRIKLEPVPAISQTKPLISRTGMICIGIIIGLTIIVLFAMMQANPSIPAGEAVLPVVNLPDLGTYLSNLGEWLRESRGMLTWFTFGVFSLFILTAIDYLFKYNKVRHGFVI
jgi:hypothetical protein